MEVTLKRELRQSDIVCPAGRVFGGCGVRCGVEQSMIDGYKDPTSIEVYCAGDHTQCPSWRKERDGEIQLEKPAEHVAMAQAAAKAVRERQAVNPEVLERVRRRTVLERGQGAS